MGGLTAQFNLSPFLKGKDFVGGLVVRLVKSPSVEDANNPKFGFKDGSLKGKVIRFTFIVDGADKVFDATSNRFIRVMDDVNVGDTVKITRTGELMETQWTVEKISNAESVSGGTPAEPNPLE